MLFNETYNKAGIATGEPTVQSRTKWIVTGLFICTAVFSSLPGFHVEKFLGIKYSWWFDMIQHSIYYLLLTLSLFFLLPFQKHAVSVALVIFFVSLVFEILQIWIPRRSFSLLDITSNFIGITSLKCT